MYDYDNLAMKSTRVFSSMKIVSVQKYNKDICILHVSDQSQKTKSTFYCPNDYVGKLVECIILNP